jgi:hypothetical protein
MVRVFRAIGNSLRKPLLKNRFGKVSGVEQRTVADIDGEKCLFVQHNGDVIVCISG